jgi:hypothetical protein
MTTQAAAQMKMKGIGALSAALIWSEKEGQSSGILKIPTHK